MPDIAEQVLKDRVCDFIGLGRPMPADLAWAVKLAENSAITDAWGAQILFNQKITPQVDLPDNDAYSAGNAGIVGLT